MIHRQFRLALCVLIAVGCTATPASAELYFSPFLGTTSHAQVKYGKSLTTDLLEETTFGVSGGTMGRIGGEIDFNYTADFFGFQKATRSRNHVLTLTGAISLRKPVDSPRRDRVSPYAS